MDMKSLGEAAAIVFVGVIGLVNASNRKMRRAALKQANVFEPPPVYGAGTGFADDKACADLFAWTGARLGFSLESGKEFRFKHKEGHVIVIGETGTMKTSGPLLSNVLGRKNTSKALVDIKTSEQTRIAGEFLANLGPYYAWAPYGLGGPTPKGVKIARFNILSKILDPKTPRNQHRALARMISEGCISGEEKGHNSFFTNGARELLADCIVVIVWFGSPREKTLPGVVRAIRADFEGFCKRTIEKADPEWAGVFRGYLGDFKAGGKGFTDILETVNSECAFLRDPAISDSFSGNDFTFEVLGARVSTIAICIPMNLINESRKVCRVMAAVALGSLLTPDRPRNVEIELFFDEAASYGALEPLLNGYATARAFGVRIWSFWTSIADGEVLYGERFRSLLGNASVQIFMGGTRDVRTAQMMSDKSGYRTITTHGKNVNYDQRTGWPVVSMNKGQARCEVLSIREAQEVPAGEALMWVRGVRGVIRCKFIPYFKQWRWFFRYRKNPLY